MARKFLIPNSMIMLENVNITNDGELAAAGGLYLTEGIHDIFSFILNKDIINMVTISGWQMMLTFEYL